MSKLSKSLVNEMTWGNVENRLGRMLDEVEHQKEKVLLETEVYVRRNPVQSSMIAAATGFVAGALLTALVLRSGGERD